MEEKLFSTIRADLFRYGNGDNIKSFIKSILTIPGFKFSFWMRLTKYYYERKLLFPLFIISYLFYCHYRNKFGIQIPFRCKIKKGLLINHFNCIVININVQIGENCTLRQGVTIGNRGGIKAPVIGDNVEFGANALILGDITIGNNVKIGAGSVVLKDIFDNCVAVGNPARIINKVD